MKHVCIIKLNITYYYTHLTFLLLNVKINKTLQNEGYKQPIIMRSNRYIFNKKHLSIKM